MNLLIALLGLLAFAGVAILFAHGLSSDEFESCANGYDPSPHATGRIGRIADAALTAPFLLVTSGSTAGTHMALGGATDRPLGPCMDTPASGERGTVLHLGASPGTVTMVASAAIAADVPVYTSGSGKISSTSASGRWLVGRSSEAAAGDGSNVEVVPCFPVVVA